MIKNNVLIGDDGFLFLHEGGHDETSLFYGEKIVSPESIANFNRNIVEREFFCKKAKVNYLHVVFPSKHVIYEEKLPQELKNNFKEKINEVKGLYKRCYKNDLTFYPEETLKYSNDLTYKKEDTHLSDLGYFLVFNEILKINEIEIKVDISKYFYIEENLSQSDLAKMIGIGEKKYQTWMPNYCYTKLDNIDYIKGHTNHCFILYNKFSLTDKRLLIFGDSFFHHMEKFFALVFREVLFFRSSNFDHNVFQMFSPDIVLTGNAERYLSQVTSDEHSSSIFLSICSSEEFTNFPEHSAAITALLSYNNNYSSYKNWVSRIEKTQQSHNLIFTINDFVRIIDDKFIASSNKSEIYINRPQEKPIKIFKLIILYYLFEDESEIFIFFKEKGKDFYEERNKITKKISKGINDIKFSISSDIEFTSVKIAPSTCQAIFDILELDLL